MNVSFLCVYYIYMCFMNVCKCLYVCMNIRTQACMYVFIYLCVCAHARLACVRARAVCVYVHVGMCLCMCIFI
jgi:hypothetical protein